MAPRLALIGALALAVPGVAAAAGQEAAQDPAAQELLALRAQDARVATVGHRLATANRDLCAGPAWLHGVVVHDLSQYGEGHRGAAVAAFALADAPAVLALAGGGPAEQAGLRPDDHLLALDDMPLPRAAGSSLSFSLVERVLDALDAAFADGEALVEVRRAGQPLRIPVAAVRGCPTRFQIVPGRSLRARADGRYVQLTSAMVAYVADEHELAWLIAHEFAHNILGHRERLDAAAVRRGLLANFGRNARLIRETEVEADRLSIFLVDRAGYDIDAGVRFWRRFGPRGLALFDAPTHPPWRRRLAALAEEAARIRSARASGRPVAPPVAVPAAASSIPQRPDS